MAFYRGEEGSVKFAADPSDTDAVIASTRSWSLSVTRDTIDTTAQGQAGGFRTFVGSFISGSGSCELLYTGAASTTETYKFITDVFTDASGINSATAEASFELYFGDAEKISFTGIITGTSYNSSSGDLATISVDFVATGAIVGTALVAA